jgi:hypothetical protein
VAGIVTVTPINPTVTFTGAPGSAIYNSSFTVVATTTSTSAPVITASGTCSITGNIVTMTSGTGTCNLIANWAADVNYNAATASQTTAAVKAATATTITSNAPNPSNVGQAVVVSFRVTGSGTPSGSVTVTATTGESCIGVLTAGAGSCSVTFLTPGLKSMSAMYAGDTNFTGGTSSAVNQSVFGSSVLVSPGALTFVNQLINTTSTVQRATLTNLGNQVLRINSIALTGANPGDFTLSNSCGGSVAAGRSCNINVALRPTTVGLRSASVTISDSDVSSPQTITLSGTGVAPVVTVSPTSWDFGTIKNRTTSQLQVTVSNTTGPAPLRILGISFSGTTPNQFRQSNNCGTSLAAGANCTINVTFAPTTVGGKSANLNLNVAAPATPQQLTLKGTAN